MGKRIFKVDINAAELAIPLDGNNICNQAGLVLLKDRSALTTVGAVITEINNQFTGAIIDPITGNLDFTNAQAI